MPNSSGGSYPYGANTWSALTLQVIQCRKYPKLKGPKVIKQTNKILATHPDFQFNNLNIRVDGVWLIKRELFMYVS